MEEVYLVFQADYNIKQINKQIKFHFHYLGTCLHGPKTIVQHHNTVPLSLVFPRSSEFPSLCCCNLERPWLHYN